MLSTISNYFTHFFAFINNLLTYPSLLLCDIFDINVTVHPYLQIPSFFMSIVMLILYCFIYYPENIIWIVLTHVNGFVSVISSNINGNDIAKYNLFHLLLAIISIADLYILNKSMIFGYYHIKLAIIYALLLKNYYLSGLLYNKIVELYGLLHNKIV